MTSAQVSQDIAPLKSFAYDAISNLKSDVGKALQQAISPDHAPRGPFLDVRAAHARRRSIRPDRCAATRSATRLGVDLPRSAAHRGAMPRRSSGGWREAQRDGAE